MQIVYVSSLRIPTERAYGQAIMKMCEAFAETSAQVILLVPGKGLPTENDPFSYYRTTRVFSVVRAWATDLVYKRAPGRIGYVVDMLTYLAAVYTRHAALLFSADLIYTRETLFVLPALCGKRVMIEIHALPAGRKRLFLWALRRAHAVVVISGQLKGQLVDAGIPAERISVLPSGVDLSIFRIDTPTAEARAQLELPDGPLFVYTGNFTTMGEDKGIRDTLLALRAVPAGTFVAVGAFAEDIERYDREAREIGVRDRVIFRGREPQERLAVYQRAADTLLMPFPDKPHYRNAMSPIKMFEYMASGRPIIATDLPTIREVLDERLAFIVPPGDHAALARAMQDACRESGPGVERARAALEQVGTYAWLERARRILALA